MNESQIKSALFTWLTKSLGDPHVFKINFDANFVIGNKIDGTFGGNAITQVSFDTDQATTLKKVASAIQRTAAIFKAVVTNTREITCTGAVNGTTVNVIGPTVSGGASQANATITLVTAPVLVSVIFANQNGEKPLYPFADVRIDSVTKVGWDEHRDIDLETEIATIGGLRRATISVNYFGPNPFEEIMKAYNALEKDSVIDLLEAAGLSILEKHDVQNLTQMLETIYEPRSHFAFYVGFADNVEDDLGIIQDVELTSIYQGFGPQQIVIGPKIIGP